MKFDGNNKVLRKQHFLFAFLIQNYTKEDFFQLIYLILGQNIIIQSWKKE